MVQEQQHEVLALDPASIGTLDLPGPMWVPLADLVDADFLPTRVSLGGEEYAWQSSVIIRGHGAVLPARIRDLQASGKKVLIIEREDRYYVFVSPP